MYTKPNISKTLLLILFHSSVLKLLAFDSTDIPIICLAYTCKTSRDRVILCASAIEFNLGLSLEVSIEAL